MIRRDTARNIIAELTRCCHPDEPVLIICVTANDVKQKMSDDHHHDDCANPGDTAIAESMDEVVRSFCRMNEDSELEDRIIQSLPEPDCDCHEFA